MKTKTIVIFNTKISLYTARTCSHTPYLHDMPSLSMVGVLLAASINGRQRLSSIQHSWHRCEESMSENVIISTIYVSPIRVNLFRAFLQARIFPVCQMSQKHIFAHWIHFFLQAMPPCNIYRDCPRGVYPWEAKMCLRPSWSSQIPAKRVKATTYRRDSPEVAKLCLSYYYYYYYYYYY